MNCFSYESPFIYAINRKPYKKVSYLRKAVIFNELPSLSSYIIIYKKFFKIKKITKIKKNREKGAFLLPISVMCYDWNMSV